MAENSEKTPEQLAELRRTAEVLSSCDRLRLFFLQERERLVQLAYDGGWSRTQIAAAIGVQPGSGTLTRLIGKPQHQPPRKATTS